MYMLENGNDARYVRVLFTCFCFLLRLIYSALCRNTKLAKYVRLLEAEKYLRLTIILAAFRY